MTGPNLLLQDKIAKLYQWLGCIIAAILGTGIICGVLLMIAALTIGAR